jgi:hypothetical protein
MIHQFRVFAGAHTRCTLECEAKSSVSPATSTVYLQIYNYNQSVWETVETKTSGSADVDFELYGNVTGLTSYKDAQNIITCRVYQYATE